MKKALGFSFLVLVFSFLVGCATTMAYKQVDCNQFPTADEKIACEKGKAVGMQELQQARENSAYWYGRTGERSYGYNSYAEKNYWPILSVKVKTWGGPWNGNNRNRRGPYEDYGPNSPACRYANMCD
ncbi:MAG: hypothetical protein AAB516_01985 [Patescibacteria group bacterium]